MSVTPPLLQTRSAQPYVAIPVTVSEYELPTMLPRLFAEARTWAAEHGLRVVGAPFVRYRDGTSDASAATTDVHVEIEAGVPVPATSAQAESAVGRADARVRAGILPPGVYATLVYTGSRDGLRDATARLHAWGEANGIAWHRRDESRAECWDARVESFLTDIAAQPDPAHWQTEIAFLTKEG